MSEAIPNINAEAAPATEIKTSNPDRYKTLVVILTVLTTVITAIIACLQADANIRASVSNRDSQVDAILVSGELHRSGLQWAYDTNVITAYLRDSQEATVMQLTALQEDQAGDTQGNLVSLQLASMAQARADTAQKFSVFFTDPRYAAKTAGGTPDMNAYLADSQAKANDLLVQQNAAADEYDRWNRKGDGYTTVLAILALSFFLFGLAQALSPRLRLLLAIFGVVALAGAGLWSVVILVG
jgi:hypothetical protein